MTGNSIIILCSFTTIIIPILFYVSFKKESDLIDIYTISVGLFFGVYSLLDALINNLSWVDNSTAFATFLLILLPLILLNLSRKFFPSRLYKYITIKYFIEQLLKVNNIALAFLLAIVIAFNSYGFIMYGILIQVNTLTALPYWFSSFNISLAYPIVILLVLKSYSNLKADNGSRYKLLWVTLFILSVIFATWYGRRSFINVGLIVILMNNAINKKRALLRRNWFFLIGMLFLTLLVSNIYQNYRGNLFDPIHSSNGTSSVYNSALDTNATMDNLRERLPLWQFNYMIQAQRQIGLAAPYGTIIMQELENSIPKFLYNEKKVYFPDATVALIYHFPVTDYPSNIFAYTNADFGYISFLLLTLGFFVFLLLISIVIKVFEDMPLFASMNFVMALEVVMNIEGNYGDYLVYARNALLLSLFYFTFRIVFISILSILKLVRDRFYLFKSERRQMKTEGL